MIEDQVVEISITTEHEANKIEAVMPQTILPHFLPNPGTKLIQLDQTRGGHTSSACELL